MSQQVVQSFKNLSHLDLKVPCRGLEISHQYNLGIFVLSNQLHLINIDDLIQGNSSKPVNTGINAHRIITSEDKIAIAFNEVVSIYKFTNLKKPWGQLNAKANVKQIAFNPADSSMIAVLSEDGNLILAKVTERGLETFVLNDTKIMCLCFSPKGKQLVVGQADGNLSQLKLDLSVARRIPVPGGIPFSVLWVSTSQFLATLIVDQDRLDLVQIDVQKAAPPLYASLGDPFISDPVTENSLAFMSLLHSNCIICSGTTSAEVLILIKSGDKWEVQILQDDRGRADLPIDNYSVGHAFYFNHNQPIDISDTEKCNPMPVFVIATQLGLIRSYAVINSQEKGEGIKFVAGVTPLNLNILFPPQLPLTQTQPMSFFSLPQPDSATSLPTPTPVITPIAPTQHQQQPFTFNFNPTTGVSSITPAQPQPEKPSLTPAPAPVSQQQSFNFASQPLTVPVPVQSQPLISFTKPLGSLGGGSGDVGTIKIPEGGKLFQKIQLEEPKKQQKTDEISTGVYNLLMELEKRFTKFQAVKATFSEKFVTDAAKLQKELESITIKEINRIEDFISNMEKTCASQLKEVQILKQKCLTDISQMEYMKTIIERNKDPTYLQLLRCQPIDPLTLKEFKAVQKKFLFIRTQIQECRKYYYFSRSPVVNASSPMGIAYIRETLSNHKKVLQKLMNDNNRIREKLGIQGTVEQITEELKKTSISDPSLTFKVANINRAKDFLKQRKIVRIEKRPEPFQIPVSATPPKPAAAPVTTKVVVPSVITTSTVTSKPDSLPTFQFRQTDNNVAAPVATTKPIIMPTFATIKQTPTPVSFAPIFSASTFASPAPAVSLPAFQFNLSATSPRTVNTVTKEAKPESKPKSVTPTVPLTSITTTTSAVTSKPASLPTFQFRQTDNNVTAPPKLEAAPVTTNVVAPSVITTSTPAGLPTFQFRLTDNNVAAPPKPEAAPATTKVVAPSVITTSTVSTSASLPTFQFRQTHNNVVAPPKPEAAPATTKVVAPSVITTSTVSTSASLPTFQFRQTDNNVVAPPKPEAAPVTTKVVAPSVVTTSTVSTSASLPTFQFRQADNDVAAPVATTKPIIMPTFSTATPATNQTPTTASFAPVFSASKFGSPAPAVSLPAFQFNLSDTPPSTVNTTEPESKPKSVTPAVPVTSVTTTTTGAARTGSIFGGGNPVASVGFGQIATASPVFGGGTAATSSFGGTGTSPSFGGGAVFGSSLSSFGNTSPAPSSGSIFGGSGTTSTTIAGSIFGGGNPVASVGFGQIATASPVFGGGTAATSSFGGGTGTSPSFGGGAVFGSSLPSFGSTSPVPSSGSIFGGGNPVASVGFGQIATASPIFGGGTAATPSFGGAGGTSPSFGGGAVFGSSSFGSTSPAVNTGSIFGGSGTTSTTIAGSIFGGGNPGVSGGFGQNPTASPVFGGGTTPTPSFGGGAVFGSSSPSSSFSGSSFNSWR